MTRSRKITPAQRKGWKSGASKKVCATTRHEAILLFQKAKMRLLDVNRWQELCGPGSAEFRLTDQDGKVLHSPLADRGNLIRISLPASPNASGSGYDWVKIEAFEQHKELMKDEESYGFRVRPVPDPAAKTGADAHFYEDAATSTFLVLRRATTVVAMELGRNETANTSAGSLFDRIRNFIVALFARLGLAKLQWYCLMKGLLASGRG